LVLPVVLLLSLALGAAATSILTLARSERVVERAALRFLDDRVRAERTLVEIRDEGGARPPGSSPPALSSLVPLGDGYLMVLASTVEGGPAYHAVYWRLEPDSVALHFPGAVEYGTTAPSGLITAAGPACMGGTAPGSLVRARVHGSSASDPPIPLGPRVGPVGLDALLALATRTVASDGRLEPGSAPELLRVPDGVALVSGSVFGVLLSAGDLAIRGASEVRGLVIAGGDVEVRGGARVDGVLLVGGTVRVLEGGRVEGCRESASLALAHPELATLHEVPGGHRLGRF